MATLKLAGGCAVNPDTRMSLCGDRFAKRFITDVPANYDSVSCPRCLQKGPPSPSRPSYLDESSPEWLVNPFDLPTNERLMEAHAETLGKLAGDQA